MEERLKPNNVTFILGNGFDLNLGMKTCYKDMYDEYINTSSKSDVICAFKNDLKNRKPYDKWSDFELGMAEYAKNLNSEDELIECVRDFKGYLVKHLIFEEDLFDKRLPKAPKSLELVKEFNDSIEKFYKQLTPNDVRKISAVLKNQHNNFNFITFNYTTSLEKILVQKRAINQIMSNTPIHIHGKLNQDVVLGIDDERQLKTFYSLSKKGKRSFVKTYFNEQYDSLRVEYAKRIIYDSDIICTYGFSMGETDKTWVDLIVEWLLEKPEHHIVIFQYDKREYNQYNYDEIMDIEDEKKAEFLKRFQIYDERISEQIHIPIGYTIFDFKQHLLEVDENKQPKDNDFNPVDSYSNNSSVSFV